jgi:hypothetical protein
MVAGNGMCMCMILYIHNMGGWGTKDVHVCFVYPHPKRVGMFICVFFCISSHTWWVGSGGLRMCMCALLAPTLVPSNDFHITFIIFSNIYFIFKIKI